MRVTVDVRHVGRPGIGRFATELAAALLRRTDGPDVVPLASRHPEEAWLGAAALSAPEDSRLLWSRPFGVLEHVELPLVVRRLGADVHHSTHMAVPAGRAAAVVLTVHDVFPLVFADHARSPAARAYYRWALPRAVQRATATVAVSEYTAAEMRRVLGVEPDAVIGHGVDHAAWKAAAWKAAEWKHAPGGGTVSGAAVPGPPVEPPYVLYVGTAKPHKNLTTLLRAHAANAALPPLVLAGPTGAEVEGAVVPAGGASGGGLSAASVGSRVRPLGRVPDAWLPTLYRGAAALAIPSRYEGVGLAALEAMSFGVPVVAADSPGLADTVGDAAVLVPTTDIGAWSDALAKVAGGGSLPWREVLTERGRQHVAGRRWDDVAAEYVRVYEAAAARVPRQ